MIGELHEVCHLENIQTKLLEALKAVRMELTKPGADAIQAVDKQIEAKRKAIQTAKTAGTLSQDDSRAFHGVIEALEAEKSILIKENPASSADAFKLLKADFDSRTKENPSKKHISNVSTVSR